MSATPRPHDLVWLNHASATEDIAEPWVAQQWRAALPVVVRRDVDDPPASRLVGMKREQRAAGWVQARNIVRSVTPRCLSSAKHYLLAVCPQPPVRGAIALTLHRWPRAGASPAVPATRWQPDPGAACGQRSGSADPRATAA